MPVFKSISTKQLERVNANTVIHYHAIIHKALKYAVKTDLIASNPADKIERPKKERFIGSFYDSTEMHKLFAAAQGTKLELIVMLAAFYGLRRSEIIGLKWDAIDFTENTLTIRHTITSFNIDGKQVVHASDRTKTKASMRTLPLVDEFHKRLLILKSDQDFHRKLCGRSYNMDYLGYVCVDELGNLIKPNYVTDCFSRILRDHGLRRIRFHDLRHSCASLLLANGVPMKQIQEWLGHSDFSTTANIYAHLDYNSKVVSAEAMLVGLDMASVKPSSENVDC
ncbi:MAG: site-specific integrase [Raoultibacter sp.]